MTLPANADPDEIDGALHWLRALTPPGRACELDGTDVGHLARAARTLLARYDALSGVVDAAADHVLALGGPWRDGALDVAVGDMAAMVRGAAPPGAEPPHVVCIDAEATRLHGEAFAVGGVVVGPDGSEVGSFYARCEMPGEAFSPWVRENVLPALADAPPTHPDPRSMRSALWDWLAARPEGSVVVADCGWPVECNLLQRCVEDDPAREMRGPYPLHEAASLALASGAPGAVDGDAPGAAPPGRAHHPTWDARASAQAAHRALARALRRRG